MQSEDVGDEHSPFSSSAQANAQTPFWIKATQTVLNSAQNSAAITIETIQGIIILSFLICNLEGVSLRYRSLISTGLLLSREIGLHRIDHEPWPCADAVQAEMSHLTWWYLVATDWLVSFKPILPGGDTLLTRLSRLLAARYGGPAEGVYQVHPLHMLAKKPRNVNDADLFTDELQVDQPLVRPTEMSYSLQRIRLAEISRSIVDQKLLPVASADQHSYYAHVMAMDHELDPMIQDIPPFFQLHTYEDNPIFKETSGIFIQAYMLNSVIYTQRCKLHIAYLTSSPSADPAYISSRQACLESAQQILRAEAQLKRSQHPFMRIRQRLPALLYSVFIAGIVLFMDACLNRPDSLQDEIIDGDIADALRMIEDARAISSAAADLYERLLQTLAKRRARHQQQEVSQTSDALQHGGASGTAAAVPTAIDIRVPCVDQNSHMLATTSSPSQGACTNINMNGLAGSFPEALNAEPSQPAQTLNDMMYLDNSHWDDLFSGIISSSFI